MQEDQARAMIQVGLSRSTSLRSRRQNLAPGGASEASVTRGITPPKRSGAREAGDRYRTATDRERNKDSILELCPTYLVRIPTVAAPGKLRPYPARYRSRFRTERFTFGARNRRF